MAEEIAIAEVMNLLEAEPAAALPAPGTDIPALREELAILVSTGKCKEEIGVNLTHEEVKRLEDKDVMKYSKRHEAHVGAMRTGALIERFLSFSTKAIDMVLRAFSPKAIGMVVGLKDTEALQNELKNDYTISKELSRLAGKLALRGGSLPAVANTLFIAAEHVEVGETSDGLHAVAGAFFIGANHVEVGADEVDNAKQPPLISE